MKAGDILTAQEALKKIFSENSTIVEKKFILNEKILGKLAMISNSAAESNSLSCKFYLGKTKDNETTGYAFIGSVAGKWGPIRYIVRINPSGRVNDVRIMSHKEKYGKWIVKRNFLDQFMNSHFSNTFLSEQDIDYITSATISSKAVEAGVKKALILFNILIKKRAPNK